jgi:hypothetical protein
MTDIALAAQTIFAELIQETLDAEFDARYDARGRFIKRLKRQHYYWHYQRDVEGRQREDYVGPVKNKAITARVQRFATIKADYARRRALVRALLAARLPRPDALSVKRPLELAEAWEEA